MTQFLVPVTVSGPHGQYAVEAIVDPNATFSTIPAPALIELGIEAHRVVRVQTRDGGAQFRQLGRALVTTGGQEDILPVLFGEPGETAVIGATTLAILLLRWDVDTERLVPIEARTTPAPA